MPDSFQSLESSAKVISICVLVILLAWETIGPCYGFFRGRVKHRIFHGIINFSLTVISAVLIAFVFSKLWMGAITWSSEHSFGLLHQLQLPLWSETLIAVLLFDIWTYWWHRINHVVPFFWRFHRVHHSDPEMDVTSANRFHFGEITLSSIFRIAIIVLIGAEIWQLALYELMMFPIVQFHHANIRLPESLDHIFRIFFPSPAMHKVHHSDFYKETNSNYTSFLSIWDRVFGSFRLQPDLDKIRLGLKEFRSDEEQTFWALLMNPFMRSQKAGGRKKEKEDG